MNLLLLEPDELGRVRLEGRRAAHLIDVLRVEPGVRVRAGVLGGGTGEAVVLQVTERGVLIDVACDPAPAPQPPIDVILAVPRPKALRRCLRAAASLGVGRIDLVNAWRVEKSYFQSPALAADALRAELVLGCEQGATTWLPEVAVHPLLMPFVRDALDRADDRLRLLPHPRAGVAIEAAVDRAGPAVIALGPEGGWIDRELATFTDRGFAAVTLAAGVLAVETALAACLAQLQLLHRIRPATLSA